MVIAQMKGDQTLLLKIQCTYGPCREKTCLWGFRQSQIQTSLLSYRDELENGNLTCSKFTYGTFVKANYKGTDQTAQAGLGLCC